MGFISKFIIIMALCFQTIALVKASQSADLPKQCAPSIQALSSCLTFVTGKGPSPTKPCCDGISDMKDKEPVCLCFFIGQAHNGSESIRSLGVQESKLLQLPTSCALKNASISNCPALLGISPKSPAASIFMNTNATSPAASVTPSSSSSTSGDKSSGFKHGYGAFGSLIAVVILIKALAF